jgi:hypothetical protein
MTGLERLLKFGAGLMVYMISFSILAGFPYAFTSGLIPSITIALGMFYYGGSLLTTEE